VIEKVTEAAIIAAVTHAPSGIDFFSSPKSAKSVSAALTEMLPCLLVQSDIRRSWWV
jgi:hypothetical protein